MSKSTELYRLTPVSSDDLKIPGFDGPSFVDSAGAYKHFGLRKSLLWRLLQERKIRAVSIRQRGRTRGKRLFDASSIRQYLLANVDIEPNDSVINEKEVA
jgi:hypothetical protein